jgi:hypothetical protein
VATENAEVERIRQKAQELLAEQRTLVRALLRLREQLGGSLIERWADCRKAGCACQRGERHGPYYVLSTRSGGRGGYTYLERPQVPQARDLVRRHRQFQDGLRRLKNLNEDLVETMRRYREAMARRGARVLRDSKQQKSAIQ